VKIAESLTDKGKNQLKNICKWGETPLLQVLKLN
jgi:hypothetical protein